MTTRIRTTPALPDTYDEQPIGSDLQLGTRPGYVASFWRHCPDGIRHMRAAGVHPTTVDEDFVLPEEKPRLTVTPQGYLTDGDLVVGIETEAHRQARLEAKRRRAEDSLQHLPIQPDELHYATTRRVHAPLEE